MKKIVIGVLFALNLFAIDWSGKVNWAMSYGFAKNLASQQNKLIMVDIALTTCPPCKYLATKVYTQDSVANYINDNFISVFYLADKDPLPPEVRAYFTGSTPTKLFLKPNGELFVRVIGARPPQIFLKTLQKINNKFKAQ